MSNVKKVKRNPIYIDLDKQRELKYTLESFAELEEKYGSVEAAFENLNNGKAKDIIFFLWCGLIHEDDELTCKKVGKMINIVDLKEVMNLVTKAVEMDTLKDDTKEDNVPN